MNDIDLFLLSSIVFGIGSYAVKPMEWKYLLAGLCLLMLGVWVG